MPVMGLIFLRHAYSRFLAVKPMASKQRLPTRGGSGSAPAEQGRLLTKGRHLPAARRHSSTIWSR
jgi:hypothetical protein